MKWNNQLMRNKALRHIAPIIFVAAAGVGLAACGSSAATGSNGGNHSTTTTMGGGSGGAAY
jgi:hypothetical protein